MSKKNALFALTNGCSRAKTLNKFLQMFVNVKEFFLRYGKEFFLGYSKEFFLGYDRELSTC